MAILPWPFAPNQLLFGILEPLVVDHQHQRQAGALECLAEAFPAKVALVAGMAVVAGLDDALAGVLGQAFLKLAMRHPARHLDLFEGGFEIIDAIEDTVLQPLEVKDDAIRLPAIIHSHDEMYPMPMPKVRPR